MNIESLFFCLLFIIETLLVIGYCYYNNKQKEQKSNTLYKIQTEINHLSAEKTRLLQEITQQKQEIANIRSKEQELTAERIELEELYEKEKNHITEEIESYKNSTQYAGEQYIHTLEQQYAKIEKEYDTHKSLLEEQKETYKKEIDTCNDKLNDLKETLNAGIRAQLREQEKKDKIDFYKLSLTDDELDDITKLNNLKTSLHQPVILSKLIWSSYFQKRTSEMCNRVLGTSQKVCGIYKITDLITQQCYIGQSVDVARRFQDHIKCGLGIDAPATNKLYKAMQEDGVWNFTFELIESCEQAQLNEKEAFWINMYQVDTYGLNSSHGIGVKNK